MAALTSHTQRCESWIPSHCSLCPEPDIGIFSAVETSIIVSATSHVDILYARRAFSLAKRLRQFVLDQTLRNIGKLYEKQVLTNSGEERCLEFVEISRITMKLAKRIGLSRHGISYLSSTGSSRETQSQSASSKPLAINASCRTTEEPA